MEGMKLTVWKYEVATRRASLRRKPAIEWITIEEEEERQLGWISVSHV
jgi:hypothetical protein